MFLLCRPGKSAYCLHHGSGNSPKKRRSPITRVEGERRLVEAAYQLTQNRPISEVGVREIATLADVNAGFVHTWFGSK